MVYGLHKFPFVYYRTLALVTVGTATPPPSKTEERKRKARFEEEMEGGGGFEILAFPFDWTEIREDFSAKFLKIPRSQFNFIHSSTSNWQTQKQKHVWTLTHLRIRTHVHTHAQARTHTNARTHCYLSVCISFCLSVALSVFLSVSLLTTGTNAKIIDRTLTLAFDA